MEAYLLNSKTSSMQKQRFCQFLYILIITLGTASMANISITNEKPGSILRGTENKRLSLECTYDGVYAEESLVWMRNGRIVADGSPGYVLYSFIPMKKDHLSEFCCEVHNAWEGKIKEKVVTLDISYKPELHFQEERNFIQGETNQLCCSSDSRPSTKVMWLFTKQLFAEEAHHKRIICLTLINISQSDGGTYSCFAENEIGIEEQEINITILYPPNIPDQHKHFTETDVSRTLQCLANGVPANYTYGQWKHLSHTGEHIRYLQSTTDGYITLPSIKNKMERYQDSGIYICTVSNGVADSSGNSFQNGKTFVISNGPPVFLEEKNHEQYGQPDKVFSLTLIVYSESDIDCYSVKREKKEIIAFMQMKSVNSRTVFHGTEISVKAIKVVLSFNLSSSDTHHKYIVTLCNGYGNSSFEEEFKATPVYINGKKAIITKVVVIICSVFLVLCVVISGITIVGKKRNMRYKDNRGTEAKAESVEGYPIPVNDVISNRKQNTDTYSEVWC